MVRFADAFPDQRDCLDTVETIGLESFCRDHSYRKTDLERDFYAEMCRVERWSVRTLRAKIQSMLFERTALSRKPEKLAKQELDASA